MKTRLRFFIAFVFCCNIVKAQNKFSEMKILLDSIAVQYDSNADYKFSYEMKEPEKVKDNAGNEVYNLSKSDDCVDVNCLCNSNIIFKGKEKSYMVFFSLNYLNPGDFRIDNSVLILKEFNDNKHVPLYLSHSDPVKLDTIKNLMTRLCDICNKNISDKH